MHLLLHLVVVPGTVTLLTGVILDDGEGGSVWRLPDCTTAVGFLSVDTTLARLGGFVVVTVDAAVPLYQTRCASAARGGDHDPILGWRELVGPHRWGW